MLRRTWAVFRTKVPTMVQGQLSPLEALSQFQLGITPPLSTQRGFLVEHCSQQLESLGITETKLIAMEPRACAKVMRKIVYQLYLAVPFRVFAFDMEFTGPPVFTAEGPTEDITEIGLYSPLLNDTFSCLVRPVCGRKQGPGVEELTHITDAMLEKQGLPFVEAWQRFLDFVQTPQPGELPGSEKRILLVSHGGKLADVSLIKWTLEKFNLELPPSFIFGDTIHLIRDAHRRRPVTVDRHPPSWKLLDLVQWLRIPPTLPAHRAGNDARMTWDALYHTLLRYGDDNMTPREQLVPRFFDEEAKQLLRELASGRTSSKDQAALDDTFLLADATLKSTAAAGAKDEAGDGAFSDTAHAKSATNDLMEMDFDDIFSGNGAAAASPSTPIHEFQLDAAEVGKEGDNSDQSSSLATHTPSPSPPSEVVVDDVTVESPTAAAASSPKAAARKGTGKARAATAAGVKKQKTTGSRSAQESTVFMV